MNIYVNSISAYVLIIYLIVLILRIINYIYEVLANNINLVCSKIIRKLCLMKNGALLADNLDFMMLQN